MVHRLKHYWKNRHQGSAALLTTIAISAILVVMFVGITTIATREIRQSISADQSNRALYAAEAGVEDAVKRLSNDPTLREETCNNLDSGIEVAVGTNGAAWTCRTITQISDKIEGKLNRDESIQLNLGKAKTSIDPLIIAAQAYPKFMKIEWNKPSVDSSTPTGASQPTLASYLPQWTQASDWKAAAVMEITATWFPRPNGALNTNLISNVFPVRTVLATPNGPSPVKDFSPWNSAGFPAPPLNTDSITANSLNSNVTTRCSGSVYSCSMPESGTYNIENLLKTEINNPSDNSKNIATSCTLGSAGACSAILRIRPRYNSANFAITFYDQNGIQVYLPDGYATIDVTARSGSYYRRVVAKKQLVPTVYDGVFDNALFSGSDICKDLKIYKDYRGAPDYTQKPDLSLDPNKAAGRNSCDPQS